MNIANLMLTSLALALSVGEPRDRAGHTPITVKSLSAARMFGTRKFRHSSNITAIAFSWNGTSIAAGGSDGAIRLWNAASGESVAEIPAHGGPLTSLCFSGDGKLLASSCQDNKIRLWDTSCWKKVSEFAGDGSGQVLVSPSNLLLAYISFSGWVRVWDIRSGMEKWAYGPGRNSATSGSFSFSGDVLAIGIQGEALGVGASYKHCQARR